MVRSKWKEKEMEDRIGGCGKILEGIVVRGEMLIKLRDIW